MIVYPREQGVVLEQTADIVEEFQWAKSLGVKLNPKIIYPVLFEPGCIGMQTTQDINPCEEILSAPNEIMLSMKLANTIELENVYKAYPSLFSIPDRSHEDNRMIAYFVWEQSKEENSFWYKYFKSLPKDVETIIDWTDADLAELQDPDFEYDSKFRRERDNSGNTVLGNALKDYPELFKEEYLSLENLNWVWKILCTRSYGRCIPYNSLIPIADLFNHTNINTNYFYATEDEPCPDINNETLEKNYEDTDEPLIELKKPLQLSSMKLYRLSFAPLKNLNETLAQVSKEILEQAQIEDSQSFIKSIL
jgi:hypothetical protein